MLAGADGEAVYAGCRNEEEVSLAETPMPVCTTPTEYPTPFQQRCLPLPGGSGPRTRVSAPRSSQSPISVWSTALHRRSVWCRSAAIVAELTKRDSRGWAVGPRLDPGVWTGLPKLEEHPAIQKPTGHVTDQHLGAQRRCGCRLALPHGFSGDLVREEFVQSIREAWRVVMLSNSGVETITTASCPCTVTRWGWP